MSEAWQCHGCKKHRKLCECPYETHVRETDMNKATYVP
jgi:hypothetical protein